LATDARSQGWGGEQQLQACDVLFAAAAAAAASAAGMSCRVHNAVLKSSEDGMASDVFWVTDLRGRKVRKRVHTRKMLRHCELCHEHCTGLEGSEYGTWSQTYFG
jgi:UTP:GlnB (protein PII) uridylyltransferase